MRGMEESDGEIGVTALIVVGFFLLLLLLAVLGYATNEALAGFAYRLEFGHRDVWNRLGQPVFLKQRASLKSFFVAPWLVQWFLLTREFKQLRDAEIDKSAARALLLQGMTMTLLLLLLAFGAWSRHWLKF